MKRTHKMELQEANVRTQQEMYLAKHLASETTSKRTHSVMYTMGRLKPKAKEI